MSRNGNLHAAKKAKNDEFYTQWRDIENEIGAYVLHDPNDYRGVMGVPITFLDKWCPEQFEIVGTDGNDFAQDLGIRAIGNTWVEQYRAAGGTGHISPNMHSLVLMGPKGGLTVYKRILIKAR